MGWIVWYTHSFKGSYHLSPHAQTSGSATTFGAKLTLAKLRCSKNIEIIWRLRQGTWVKTNKYKQHTPKLNSGDIYYILL